MAQDSYYANQTVGQPFPASNLSESLIRECGFTFKVQPVPDASDLDMSDEEFKCWKRTYKPLKKITKKTLLIEIASYKNESLGYALYVAKK